MANPSKWVVVIEHERGITGHVYLAWCPDIPGCTARGTTPDDALTRITAAITGHLAATHTDWGPPERYTVAAAVVTVVNGGPKGTPSAASITARVDI